MCSKKATKRTQSFRSARVGEWGVNNDKSLTRVILNRTIVERLWDFVMVARFRCVSMATCIQKSVTASALNQARAHPAGQKEFARAWGAIFIVFAFQWPVICKQRQSRVSCQGLQQRTSGDPCILFSLD